MNRSFSKNILMIIFNKNKEMKRKQLKHRIHLILTNNSFSPLLVIMSSFRYFLQITISSRIQITFSSVFFWSIYVALVVFLDTLLLLQSSLQSSLCQHFTFILSVLKLVRMSLKKYLIFYTNLFVLSYLSRTAHLLLNANLRY